ncbi:hypothetical protein DYB32_001455 [Aphanomyces invadans]|uniref:J domain-containing protein n=1 Tax=Aphanomyces invadans TaxID=157072 RepID=A0A3R6VS46_9STRA|nr:hypothetical protein DYB32_001455 [Aphanomyces invadans]
MAPRHTKLYDVMGVAPNVTQEELKKAYRRKALQLHPDKRGNTPEAQEEFTIMKSAYDILSDPKQRDIYDMMGEDGVKLVHQYGDLRPDELLVAMLNSLAQSGPLGKCIIFSFVAVFVGFFILIPRGACCCRSLLLLKGLAFVGFQLLVAMKLQGGIPNIDVPIVFAPYFVLEGFYLVEKIIAGILSYSAFAAATAAGPSVGTGQSRATLVLEIVNSWVMSVLRLAFGVLVAFKLDDALDISWWVAFVPVWIYTATLVVPHVLAYVRHKKTAPSTNSADDTSAGPSLGGLLCLIVGTLVFMSPFFILAYRLQSGDFSSFYVLLPWLIVVG